MVDLDGGQEEMSKDESHGPRTRRHQIYVEARYWRDDEA